MVKLTGVSETLLVPLCARYHETLKADGIIRDEKALEIVKLLEVDCERFAEMPAIQLGIAIRTEILDRETRKFLAANERAAVVNLGAGLCTRFFRVDDQKVLWFELDLAEVGRVWDQIFSDTERHHRLLFSVLDFRWLEQIRLQARGRRLLFIAEGLLMYFTAAEVRRLVLRISEEFPGSEMLLEAMSPLMARNTRRHPAVSQTSATFKWGISSVREMERWDQRIKFVDEWYYLDQHGKRWGWMRLLALVPPLRKQMKVGHLRLG